MSVTMWYPGSDCGGFDAFLEWVIAGCMAAQAAIAIGLFVWMALG
jgi:hypothetical protein